MPVMIENEGSERVEVITRRRSLATRPNQARLKVTAAIAYGRGNRSKESRSSSPSSNGELHPSLNRHA